MLNKHRKQLNSNGGKFNMETKQTDYQIAVQKIWQAVKALQDIGMSEYNKGINGYYVKVQYSRRRIN